MPEPARSGPRLLADIGATYARLCIETTSGRYEQVAVLPCADYAGFVDLVQTYLRGLAGPHPHYGAVAIANPIEGDWNRMTNRDWAFSVRDAQRALGLRNLLVVNNFTALAMSLPRLGAGDRRKIGGGDPNVQGVIGLLGPGTGLGVSGLIPSGDRWVTLATEGGHVSFAPTDERELRVLQHAWKTMPRVSAERLLSGPGLELIHGALAQGASPAEAVGTAEIVRRALEGSDATCVDTVDCFCAMLGSMAADLALTLGATGGIYVGGGIVPRLGKLFDRSPFRLRFEAKGRFSSYVARIPTYVLTAEHLTFDGLSTLLAGHLPEPEQDAVSPLLDRVRTARGALSPAERRVADFVLDNPRTALTDPVASIARRAEVSQPTVIRFCRSLGFQGLADFKLKLGSGLTGALPVQRMHVRRGDSTADLCAKVLDNTISAIVHFRESLNVETIDRAVDLLATARRVEFYALGNSAIVALDAVHKLFRFRVPSVAHADPALLTLAAEMLEPDAVAVFISSSGQPPELVRASAIAVERGVRVIAITAGQSPLARKATVCIPVEHTEDSATFVSMISRILHLLAVDLLSVGLAMRRPRPGSAIGAASSARAAADGGQTQPAPGVLISHIA